MSIKIIWYTPINTSGNPYLHLGLFLITILRADPNMPQYSVFGQVAASDVNNPNPYMFAGRRYDIEIGLYYNRARYYNPFTGRFLQADPVGYDDGINWYLYCMNNPVNRVDPSGCTLIVDSNSSGSWSDFIDTDINDVNYTIVVIDVNLSLDDISDMNDLDDLSNEPSQAKYKPGSEPKNWPYPGKGWTWNKEGYYEKGGKRKHYHKDQSHRGHWDVEDGKGNLIGREYEEISLTDRAKDAIVGAYGAAASAIGTATGVAADANREAAANPSVITVGTAAAVVIVVGGCIVVVAL